MQKTLPFLFIAVFILIVIAEFSIKVETLICYSDDSGVPTNAYILNRHIRFEDIQKKYNFNYCEVKKIYRSDVREINSK